MYPAFIREFRGMFAGRSTVKRAIFVLSFSLLNCACAVNVMMPATHFLSPETNGKLFAGQVDLGSTSGPEAQVVVDELDSTPDTTPSLHQNSRFGGGFNLGLASSLDTFVLFSEDAPTFYGLKVQLLGDHLKSAKKGNFALSLAAAFGAGSQSDEVSSTTTAMDSAQDSSKYSGWYGSVLFGYRPSDPVLIYLAPFFMHVAADVTVNGTHSGTTTQTANPKGKGDNAGADLGIYFGHGDGFFGVFELSYSKANWTRNQPSDLKAKDESALYTGGSLGYAW